MNLKHEEEAKKPEESSPKKLLNGIAAAKIRKGSISDMKAIMRHNPQSQKSGGNLLTPSSTPKPPISNNAPSPM
jgi:hypothetical protein